MPDEQIHLETAMETKNISGNTTQPVTPFGTAPIPAPPTLKQTQYDGALLKDRYQIEGELGRGGIGVVYLARDTQLLNRRVVIKVLLQDAGQSLHTPWFKKKFEQEIEALVRLDHPGIVGVLDVGTMPDGKEFFVMQYVEGVTLRSLMKEQPLSLGQIGNMMRQIGNALSSAHDRGIIHRDLKPENIMLQRLGDDEEQIKLIDFGIATVKDSQVATQAEKTKVAGALPYMAPEQLRGQPDVSSDVWALGVMAYEMLTGRMPYYADTLVQLHELQQRGPQIPPSRLREDLPPTAESVILKALAFDPQQRYARAKDLGEDLARALTGAERLSGSFTGEVAPVNANTNSARLGPNTVATHSAQTQVDQSTLTAEVRREPVTIATGSQTKLWLAAVALLAIVGLGLWWWRSRQPDPTTSSQTTPTTATTATRNLSYSLRVLAKSAPNEPPKQFNQEIVFTPGDQLCFVFNSTQNGFLYLINEGPKPQDGLPSYNAIFPAPEISAANAPTINAGQSRSVPDGGPANWLVVDKEKGTETFWLVWSERPIPELEAVRKWISPEHGGEIKDKTQITAVQQFLSQQYPTTKPTVELDENQKNLRGGKDGVLIYPIKLEHR